MLFDFNAFYPNLENAHNVHYLQLMLKRQRSLNPVPYNAPVKKERAGSVLLPALSHSVFLDSFSEN